MAVFEDLEHAQMPKCTIQNIKIEILNNGKPTTNLVLFPLLYAYRANPFVNYNQNGYKLISKPDLYKFFREVRFFSNLSNRIKQNIDYAEVMDDFQKCWNTGEIDSIVDKYNNDPIIQDEFKKLNLMINPPDSITREEVEQIIWKIEDFYLCSGSINLFLEGIECTINDLDEYHLRKLERFGKHFISLFLNPTDTLRRALLTYGHYFFYDTYTIYIDMNRFNFGDVKTDWQIICNDTEKRKFLLLLVNEFMDYNVLSNEEYEIHLFRLIKNRYQITEQRFHKLILDPSYFAFAQNKRVCIKNDEIAVLRRIRVTSDKAYLNIE